MYIYANSNTGEFLGFAPRGRGRIAENHEEIGTAGLRMYLGVVPDGTTLPVSVTEYKKFTVPFSGCAEASETEDGRNWLNNFYKSTLIALSQTLAAIGDSASSATVDAIREAAGDLLFTENSNNLPDMFNRVIAQFQKVNDAISTGTVPKKEKMAEKTAPAVEPAATEEHAPEPAVVAENETNDVGGVFFPQKDETYVVKPQIEGLLGILTEAAKKCPQNVNLIGPHGCGKTELAIQFAARTERPMLIMDCANLREARDWFGYKTAKDGTVYWHESQFVRAVEAGNHVILLDELNRANPSLLNTLMPLLDGRRFTYLEEKGSKIRVGAGTVFFATMNEGAGYTGTSALDRAVRDRFPRAVELQYLEERDEIQLLVKRTNVEKTIARRLVQMANKVRQSAVGMSAELSESISTRQLIAAAHDFVLGGVDTLEFTITNHFSADGDADSERGKVQSIIQGKFGDIIAANAVEAAEPVKSEAEMAELPSA